MSADGNSVGDKMTEAVRTLVENQPRHYYLVNGEIDFALADRFVALVKEKRDDSVSDCGLVLTTDGGDPDAGFRLMRVIKRYYRNCTIYVLGRCKSTGTLIALGADEVVMDDYGEFGPLDIQLAKDDEMISTSGLSYYQSLTSLNDQLFTTFERSFLGIKQRSNHTITTKTAAEIASTLAIGLTAPISAQIDPVKLGEVQRAINIADSYGKRLCDDRKLVQRLIGSYPSHGFVIDFEEAEKIFSNVRWINGYEENFAEAFHDIVRFQQAKSFEIFLNDFLIEEVVDEGGAEANQEAIDADLIEVEVEEVVHDEGAEVVQAEERDKPAGGSSKTARKKASLN